VTVSYTAFFAVWIAAAAGCALAVGIFYAWRDARARPPHRRVKLYRCLECERVYEDPRNVPLSPCPRCGALNEAVRR
jgi:hypothetical protein